MPTPSAPCICITRGAVPVSHIPGDTAAHARLEAPPTPLSPHAGGAVPTPLTVGSAAAHASKTVPAPLTLGGAAVLVSQADMQAAGMVAGADTCAGADCTE